MIVIVYLSVVSENIPLRLRSHGTGRIRDSAPIRPVTAVHTKPDKLQAKQCSHGAGRIRARNDLLAHCCTSAIFGSQ